MEEKAKYPVVVSVPIVIITSHYEGNSNFYAAVLQSRIEDFMEKIGAVRTNFHTIRYMQRDGSTGYSIRKTHVHFQPEHIETYFGVLPQD